MSLTQETAKTGPSFRPAMTALSGVERVQSGCQKEERVDRSRVRQNAGARSIDQLDSARQGPPAFWRTRLRYRDGAVLRAVGTVPRGFDAVRGSARVRDAGEQTREH